MYPILYCLAVFEPPNVNITNFHLFAGGRDAVEVALVRAGKITMGGDFIPFAKHIFKVPRVVTRIYDPIRQDTYKALGLDAISPTVIGAQVFYSMLVGKEEGQGS